LAPFAEQAGQAIVRYRQDVEPARRGESAGLADRAIAGKSDAVGPCWGESVREHRTEEEPKPGKLMPPAHQFAR